MSIRVRQGFCSMDMTGVEHCNSRKILRLQRCPQCDYDLSGLPRQHRCPECGFEYDPNMFALYGWRRDDRFSVAGRLLIGVWWERIFALVIFVVLTLGIAYQAYRTWKSGQLQSGFLVMMLVLIVIPASRMRRHSRKTERAQRGTVQLLFTAEGASIRRGPGDSRLIPWGRFRRLRFRKLRYHSAGTDSWHLRLNVPYWHLRWRSDDVEGIIECTRREAALVRGEIRRRWRVACAAAIRERNV